MSKQSASMKFRFQAQWKTTRQVMPKSIPIWPPVLLISFSSHMALVNVFMKCQVAPVSAVLLTLRGHRPPTSWRFSEQLPAFLRISPSRWRAWMCSTRRWRASVRKTDVVRAAALACSRANWSVVSFAEHETWFIVQLRKPWAELLPPPTPCVFPTLLQTANLRKRPVNAWAALNVVKLHYTRSAWWWDRTSAGVGHCLEFWLSFYLSTPAVDSGC